LPRLKRHLDGNPYEAARHGQRIKRNADDVAVGHGGVSVCPDCNQDDKVALEHLILLEDPSGGLSQLVVDQAYWSKCKRAGASPADMTTVDSGNASNTYGTYGSKMWRMLRVL